jgi:hypothetical protein
MIVSGQAVNRHFGVATSYIIFLTVVLSDRALYINIRLCGPSETKQSRFHSFLKPFT